MNLPDQPFQRSAQFGPSVTSSYDENQQGKSRLRSPIPPDPGYGEDHRPFRY